MPPYQNTSAINGSGITHSGLRLIQKQPSPKSSSQTAMKIPTAHPGAINPEARKKGARASIAARAKPATTYLATVRASRGMPESSHLRGGLSGDQRAMSSSFQASAALATRSNVGAVRRRFANTDIVYPVMRQLSADQSLPSIEQATEDFEFMGLSSPTATS